MIAIETIALVIAILSLVVSTIYNAYQTRQSSKAYLLNQQIERGNAIIHFNSKFAELTSKINREQQFGDPDWANKFWSLQWNFTFSSWNNTRIYLCFVDDGCSKVVQ
ncbi:MAG: hypothetical protein IPJ94_09590 [Chloroflexi bacterium]|nr:hypothetical protein [Chloroflexota bacterium]